LRVERSTRPWTLELSRSRTVSDLQGYLYPPGVRGKGTESRGKGTGFGNPWNTLTPGRGRGMNVAEQSERFHVPSDSI
jgi:hypothetical protein